MEWNWKQHMSYNMYEPDFSVPLYIFCSIQV
jgi:hypothetical protein